MLVNKNTSKKLIAELNIRYSNLHVELEGRQVDNQDGIWTQDTLDRSLAIDDYRLRLAVADFKTILAEIGKLK